MTSIFWIFRWTPPSRVDRWFRRLQLVSAAAFSLNHGANDAQKTMGIIAGVLLAAGYIETFYIPFWVVLAAHAAIGLGTLAGGWRIIHTMGSKITKLQPVGGFAAETGAAISILIATQTGVPVSTTHAITGAIVGVGATRRLSAVRWGVAGQIVWAWVLTIPAAFAIGAGAYTLLRLRRALRRARSTSRSSSSRDVRRSAVRRRLSRSAGLCGAQARSSIVNRAPPSGRFSARTRPPCSSTRCLTIARPRPVPPGSRARDLSTR